MSDSVKGDRELLELAAKAIGIDLENQPYRDSISVSVGGLRWQNWNPLESDADALRLAVKLGLYVECNRGDTEVRCAQNDGNFYITQRFNGDPLSATRRAIVRAAAAIGETL